MNVLEPSRENGKLEVIVSKDKFVADIEEEILSDANRYSVSESGLGRKTYAMSLFDEESGGRRIVVGVYGRG